MPRTINRVELLGRVGAEPEMRYTQGDTAVTQLRLATDRGLARHSLLGQAG